MLHLSPVTWTLAFLLAAIVGALGALATPLGRLLPGCVPAYWTMEPDVNQVQSYQFLVQIIEPDRRVRWQQDYTFVSRPCCQTVRNPVAEVVSHLQDLTASVSVGECR